MSGDFVYEVFRHTSHLQQFYAAFFCPALLGDSIGNRPVLSIAQQYSAASAEPISPFFQNCAGRGTMVRSCGQVLIEQAQPRNEPSLIPRPVRDQWMVSI